MYASRRHYRSSWIWKIKLFILLMTNQNTIGPTYIDISLSNTLSRAGVFNLSDSAGHINNFNDARGPQSYAAAFRMLSCFPDTQRTTAIHDVQCTCTHNWEKWPERQSDNKPLYNVQTTSGARVCSYFFQNGRRATAKGFAGHMWPAGHALKTPGLEHQIFNGAPVKSSLVTITVCWSVITPLDFRGDIRSMILEISEVWF
jgi:hypothetical protein